MKRFLFMLIMLIIVTAIGIGAYILFINNKKIIVSFNTNSANPLNNLEIKKGESINLPTLEREGYEFLGWYVGDEKVDSNYKFDKTTILSAKWEKKSSENKKTYTVTFYIRYPKLCDCISSCNCPNSIDADPYLTKKVEEGEKVDEPAVPDLSKVRYPGELNGYQFVSWETKDRNMFDFNTPITSDLKLYSKMMLDDGNGEKPIIYLYPEKEMDVEVKLGSINNIITIYPKYNDGWKVKAYPSGKLIDQNTGRELYSLYWEGKNYPAKVTSEGFVVKGDETANFLEKKLEILGLTEREAEEFIIYWLPQMEHNKYNYIRFETKKEIDNYMPLEINPKPDVVIRILMEFMQLDEKINVKEQKLTKVERRGFTVVEWGGSKLNQGVVR